MRLIKNSECALKQEETQIIIRAAQERDVPYLLDIYNYEVLHKTSTFDLNPRTLADRLDWFYGRNVGTRPLIVAEKKDRAVDYACLSEYCIKEAYAATVELSVYVGREYRKRGIALCIPLILFMMLFFPLLKIVHLFFILLIAVVTARDDNRIAEERA